MPEERYPRESSLDLRRLDFRTDGLTVNTYDGRDLDVFTEEWLIVARSASEQQGRNALEALRGVMRRNPGCREDVLGGERGSPTIYRFLRGVGLRGEARGADYVISIGPYWMNAGAHSVPRGSSLFSTEKIDALLLSFRLLDEPRLGDEVPPAWKEYQANRRTGMPWAKFVLSNDAPICLGNYARFPLDLPPFRSEDWERGGRQIAPDQIEFYTKEGNAISIRVDVWLENSPRTDSSRIFHGGMRVSSPRLDIWSFEDPEYVNVPVGDYDVDICVQNQGKYENDWMPERQYFTRDDLERYEIFMTRRLDRAKETPTPAQQ